ncbi:hypothetical protein M900_A0238 [Bacteriovorax sp. Seq25_V]|nr:hypothetical protein M900_A0238 [Bacteriovorax sp. Seq25_V]
MSNLAIGAHFPEGNEKQDGNPYFITRLFKTIDETHSIVTTVDLRKEDKRNEGNANISLRRNVSRFVQYGFEADLNYGHRHDNDWQQNTSTGNWSWKKSSENIDFGSSLFLKLRRDISIKEKLFTGSVNLKTHNNWTKTLLTLKPELILTYHHFDAGAHKYNIYFKNSYYIPLNYSSKDIYISWYYLGWMFNYSKQVKPFAFIAYKDQTWTKSKDFKRAHPDENYELSSKFSYLGVGFNYYF